MFRRAIIAASTLALLWTSAASAGLIVTIEKTLPGTVGPGETFTVDVSVQGPDLISHFNMDFSFSGSPGLSFTDPQPYEPYLNSNYVFYTDSENETNAQPLFNFSPFPPPPYETVSASDTAESGINKPVTSSKFLVTLNVLVAPGADLGDRQLNLDPTSVFFYDSDGDLLFNDELGTIPYSASLDTITVAAAVPEPGVTIARRLGCDSCLPA